MCAARHRLAEFVHLHRMIDHQFGRHERIDLLRIAAERIIASRMAAKIMSFVLVGEAASQVGRQTQILLRREGRKPAALGLGQRQRGDEGSQGCGVDGA